MRLKAMLKMMLKMMLKVMLKFPGYRNLLN